MQGLWPSLLHKVAKQAVLMSVTPAFAYCYGLSPFIQLWGEDAAPEGSSPPLPAPIMVDVLISSAW